MSALITNRYDFEALIEVLYGNPNGDPDADNMPRVDAETGIGFITDVCLKRKIRNYVSMVKAGDDRYRMYIQRGVTLNANDNEAFEKVAGIKNAADRTNLKNDLAKTNATDRDIKDYLCEHFYDVRTFGAVVTTLTKGALNYGQIRGPVQFDFARSVDPIMPVDVTITRMAITKESDAKGTDDKNGKINEFGHKYIIPYGLYTVTGHVSANLAKNTGYSENDLALFWQAVMHMFDEDCSAARSEMNVRKLVVFKHDSIYGNAPAYKLFDAVSVHKKDGVDVSRKYEDYDVSIDKSAIPAGVDVTEYD